MQKRVQFQEIPWAAPVFVYQRGLIGVQGPIKNETAQKQLDDLKGRTYVHNR